MRISDWSSDVCSSDLVLAGQDDDAITLLDPGSSHHSTSGASEMIFMCLRARSSRTTGPKIRVPIGSSFLLTSTAAFESKRITEPSARRMSFAVRTMTARCTRSEEHTSELQSLMRTSYAVFCLQK